MEIYQGPSVSVIIPTYDEGQPLRRALQSVHVQTYDDIETIVVDVASSDGTAEILQEWHSSGIHNIRQWP
jgi:glycosyltransferase involved in cell wall biosynthesis